MALTHDSFRQEDKKTDGKILIGIDVDGVVLDFVSVFDDFVAKKFNLHRVPDDEHGFSEYDLKKRYGNDDMDIHLVFDKFIKDGGYANLPAYKDTRRAIEQIVASGCDFCFITAVPLQCALERTTNLEHVLGIDNFRIFCVGLGASKKDVLHRVKPDFFIDDRVKYLNESHESTSLVLCNRKERQCEKFDPTKKYTVVQGLSDWVDNYMEKDILNKIHMKMLMEKPEQYASRPTSAYRQSH